MKFKQHFEALRALPSSLGAGGSLLARTALLAAGAVLLALPTLHAQDITFDELPGSVDLVPAGYAGLQWTNVTFANPLDLGLVPSGYANGVVSGTNIATNGDFGPASFSSIGYAFHLNSLYLTAAWNDGLSVQLTGWRNGVQRYSSLYVVNTNAPLFVTPGFLDIDTVQISSYGGTPNTDLYMGAGEAVVIDNVHITPVPEPSTYGLLGATGLAALGFYRRRSRKA